MDQIKEWIQAFEQTKIGKTLKGKEAFRNNIVLSDKKQKPKPNYVGKIVKNG